MALREYECGQCNLIYSIEALNFVSGDTDALLDGHCPHCGSEEVSQWTPERD